MIGQFIRKNDISNSHSRCDCSCRSCIDNGFHFEIIGQDGYTHGRHDFSDATFNQNDFMATNRSCIVDFSKTQMLFPIFKGFNQDLQLLGHGCDNSNFHIHSLLVTTLQTPNSNDQGNEEHNDPEQNLIEFGLDHTLFALFNATTLGHSGLHLDLQGIL